MAESRRVQLTTLTRSDAFTDPVGPELAPKSPPRVLEVPGTRPVRPADTARFLLTLTESDERSFPEFSYTQLVESKIVHLVKNKGPPGAFEEEEKADEDEVAAIAKRLEKKYGDKPKKMKDRIQDLIDIGYGYDEEDSFIDNSEAYDEFVPASITTTFGGFYINSGPLQFRQTSDTEREDTTERKLSEQSKKRKLNGGQGKAKKKQCREEEMEINMDVKMSTSSETGADEHTKEKKKKPVGTLSVTNMLKKFQREKNRERQKMYRGKRRAAPTIPLFPADAAGGGDTGLTDPLLTLIGSTADHALIQAASTMDFDLDLDSLLDVTEETMSPKALAPPATDKEPQTKPEDHTTHGFACHTQAQLPSSKMKMNVQPKPHPPPNQLLSETKTTASQSVPLPDGLPAGLQGSIGKLMVAAKTSEGESKVKFFTPEINSILLDVELQCRDQGGQLRSKVYTHLSSFLPCSRETLLKRVKKLLLTHADDADKEDHTDKEACMHPMQKLKEAIGRAMPEQIACFHDNCLAYVKSSKTTEDCNEGKQKGNVGPAAKVEEKSVKRGPTKLFRWNEEIRECLCHVVSAKMDRYETERKESQEVEEYLKTFLDNEVKQLWPKGWMQSRVLMRESRKIIGLPASLLVKKTKMEKKQSFVSEGPSVSHSWGDSPESISLKGGLALEMDASLYEDLPAGEREMSVMKKMEAKLGEGVAVGSSTPVETDKQPLISSTPAPTHSLLDLLAEQALARAQPLTQTISQELLAAAIAKCKQSAWSLGLDLQSPPLPPPPPQSSPVAFPGNRECRVAAPHVLQNGDFAGHGGLSKMRAMSEDADVIIIT
ncbi:ubinuclein-1-like [Genypterus blacodes]|uniref:ubinuclein-1-like n=1 Tax=Genypterus blacodes TaxID=154954 RepID=UPI003F75738D